MTRRCPFPPDESWRSRRTEVGTGSWDRKLGCWVNNGVCNRMQLLVAALLQTQEITDTLTFDPLSGPGQLLRLWTLKWSQTGTTGATQLQQVDRNSSVSRNSGCGSRCSCGCLQASLTFDLCVHLCVCCVFAAATAATATAATEPVVASTSAAATEATATAPTTKQATDPDATTSDSATAPSATPPSSAPPAAPATSAQTSTVLATGGGRRTGGWAELRRQSRPKRC